MSDKAATDPLADAKRIMGNLARTPHKPHKAKKTGEGATVRRKSRRNKAR